MSNPNQPQHYFLLVRSRSEAAGEYSLATAAKLAGVHEDLVRHYCRIGLLGDTRQTATSEPVFDDQAIYEIRRIEHFRKHHAVNLRALPLVYRLTNEIERLSAELRTLRGRHGL
jgi:DNA-binding transcriptional MerR regulator